MMQIIDTIMLLIQDGGASKLGTVTGPTYINSNNWLNVKWDNGNTNRYRMGAENSYDLQLAGNV